MIKYSSKFMDLGAIGQNAFVPIIERIGRELAWMNLALNTLKTRLFVVQVLLFEIFVMPFKFF